MTCSEARRLMLEADPAALTPQADSALGAHLGTCASCRGAAAEIRELEAGLAAWLAHSTPRGEGTGAVARAGAAARRRTRARRLGAALSLAAAAGLAALLIFPPRRPPSGPPLPPPPAMTAGGFSVVAPPGRQVMVLQPADSNIVVVWYLPYRRSS